MSTSIPRRPLLIGSLIAIALSGCGGGGGSSMPFIPTSTPTSPSPPPATAGSFTATSLVSDVALGAYSTTNRDTHLVNAWGIAFNPKGFVWVADNGTNSSTLYDGNGVPQSLVVSTPPSPTGIVFNGSSTDFMLTSGGKSGPSFFVFATEGGMLAAWSPTVEATTAVPVYDGSAAGKVYKGLAIASQGGANFLYATDFHNGAVDVFNGSFQPSAANGAFKNPLLPLGYAPFGIQALGNLIYVSYAKQDGDAHDEVGGAGLGLIAVYDTAGTFIKQLVMGGALNAPWGMAMAPGSGFGAFNGALLVGNFGDGTINAYDPNSGTMLGTLADGSGAPLVIDGLWGIAFGNGIANQPTTTLFFAAGPNDEHHGLYGRIDAR
ncbi:TIGR03118 family protein [Variovorax sp. YR216]|uniref:TIGR03118 family protein n=1 Tax=Variovorax sp. YR216 TaxID=1882828 RepID=UPI00089CD49F|nr:TIGR03118 family protein [Variovorax sp. YR216]SEB16326.1 TIGR03118 family protein [Variovorax sp. YR216]